MTIDERFKRIEHVTADRRSQERDRRLGERFESLASAMGEFIASQAHK